MERRALTPRLPSRPTINPSVLNGFSALVSGRLSAAPPPTKAKASESTVDHSAASNGGLPPQSNLDETIRGRLPHRDADVALLRIDEPVRPRMVGGYKLTKFLAGGTSSEVWKAVAPGGILVAARLVAGGRDDAIIRREMQGLELQSQARHVRVLGLHRFDFDDCSGQLVAITNLADGTIEEWLRKQTPRRSRQGLLREKVRLIGEVAEGLTHLNDLGIVHRDIKPPNVCVTAGHAQLADFGLACRLEGDGRLRIAAGGTPSFMAPEAWQGWVCPATDQYALAVTYLMLRRDEASSPFSTRATGRPASFVGMPDLSGLPEREREVLTRALAQDPAERFPNCSEFAASLTEAVVDAA